MKFKAGDKVRVANTCTDTYMIHLTGEVVHVPSGFHDLKWPVSVMLVSKSHHLSFAENELKLLSEDTPLEQAVYG